MVQLGNFQLYDISQNKPEIKYNTLTDIYSLNKNKNKIVILQSFDFPNFRWSQSYIKSRFTLAEKYKDQADYLVFLMQEEIYQPIASTGFQKVPLSSANGSSYQLEGITIPAMPSAGSANYFIALLKAWHSLCQRLNKKSALCGCPISKTTDLPGLYNWIYTTEGTKYVAQNYDMVYLYRYPTTLNRANGTEPHYNAKPFIDYWRKILNYNGIINYVLDTKFTDTGSSNTATIKADFKNAADNLRSTDIISAYPFINQSSKDIKATERLIQISNEYNKQNETITCKFEPILQ
jgi:hypothetical protein